MSTYFGITGARNLRASFESLFALFFVALVLVFLVSAGDAATVSRFFTAREPVSVVLTGRRHITEGVVMANTTKTSNKPKPPDEPDKGKKPDKAKETREAEQFLDAEGGLIEEGQERADLDTSAETLTLHGYLTCVSPRSQPHFLGILPDKHSVLVGTSRGPVLCLPPCDGFGPRIMSHPEELELARLKKNPLPVRLLWELRDDELAVRRAILEALRSNKELTLAQNARLALEWFAVERRLAKRRQKAGGRKAAAKLHALKPGFLFSAKARKALNAEDDGKDKKGRKAIDGPAAIARVSAQTLRVCMGLLLDGADRPTSKFHEIGRYFEAEDLSPHLCSKVAKALDNEAVAAVYKEVDQKFPRPGAEAKGLVTVATALAERKREFEKALRNAVKKAEEAKAAADAAADAAGDDDDEDDDGDSDLPEELAGLEIDKEIGFGTQLLSVSEALASEEIAALVKAASEDSRLVFISLRDKLVAALDALELGETAVVQAKVEEPKK